MAQRTIETMIEIAAPPETVWETLTDFETMPSWNPFIRAISGEPVAGRRLSIRIAPPGRSEMRFSPVVLVARPGREFRWRGRLLVPGIFDGEHYFVLERKRDGGTLLVHGERFSGILVSMFGSGLSATEAGFRLMNVALKTRAENAGAAVA